MNPEEEENVTAGLPREDALRIYTESVNRPDTLFSYNPSLPEKLDRMRELLHDPITVDEAYALNDVLYRRRRFTDMIAWLQDEPISWEGYFVRETFRAEEADRKLAEYLNRQDEDWANGVGDFAPRFSPEDNAREIAEARADHLPSAHPCPRCCTPAESLEWFSYSTPPSVWRCFYSGWKTRCPFCLQEVDFFVEVMGRGKRPTPADGAMTA